MEDEQIQQKRFQVMTEALKKLMNQFQPIESDLKLKGTWFLSDFCRIGYL